MSSPTPRSDRELSRAHARRRTRLAARGEPVDELENEAEAPPAPEPNRSFLSRLFPPAPALPNRPDPLKGFDESGPLRPIRARAFLLRRNLLAWLATGVLAFVGYLAQVFYAVTVPFLSLLGTFLLFGSLIAAGWFGWQRPTLYGTAASLVSFSLVALFVLVDTFRMGAPPTAFGSPDQVAIGIGLQAIYQAGLGFLGGWYGGYLRRRQTQISAQSRRRR